MSSLTRGKDYKTPAPQETKRKEKAFGKKRKPRIVPKAREVDINKLIQLNEEMVTCLDKGGLGRG